ncbi:MAG: hypothetical protein C5B50_20670 [Verrucomicrobia bacterium]|nr:MAG: hypothetical protein C5B50_20670 [Verrucomicrobiota bacterium]
MQPVREWMGRTTNEHEWTRMNRQIFWCAVLVAQISNLLYRSASSLQGVCAGLIGRSADWKSAIRQVGNLRYV